MGFHEHKGKRRIMRENKARIEIDTTEFELDGFQSRIESFCHNSRITKKGTADAQLVFEELVKNNIAEFIEHNDDRGLPIVFLIEHYGIFGDVEITITYGGDRYDPIYEGDELSALVIKKIASDIKYSYDGENKLMVVIGR